jgi:hypothetical protein
MYIHKQDTNTAKEQAMSEIAVGTVVEINPWLTGTVTKLGPVEASVKGADGRSYRIGVQWLVPADNTNVRL